MSKKMKARFAFLVRDTSGVALTFTKPAEVKIVHKNRRWQIIRGGKMFTEEYIGGSHGRFLYSDSWEGIIGVYDLSKQTHHHAMHKQARAHDREFLSDQLKRRLDDIYGEKVVKAVEMKAMALLHGSSKHTDKKLIRDVASYLSVRNMLNETCREV